MKRRGDEFNSPLGALLQKKERKTGPSPSVNKCTVLTEKTNSQPFSYKQELLPVLSPLASEIHNIATFSHVQCLFISRQKERGKKQSNIETFNKQECLKTSEVQRRVCGTGPVQTSWTRFPQQFRLRSEGAKCRSREDFSPTVEIKSKKLALDVLAHIQSLASTTRTSRTDADKRRLSDEVSAKVLLRNPAKDTTSSEQGLTGSLGADESKGFLSFVFCFLHDATVLQLIHSLKGKAHAFFHQSCSFLQLVDFCRDTFQQQRFGKKM